MEMPQCDPSSTDLAQEVMLAIDDQVWWPAIVFDAPEVFVQMTRAVHPRTIIGGSDDDHDNYDDWEIQCANAIREIIKAMMSRHLQSRPQDPQPCVQIGILMGRHYPAHHHHDTLSSSSRIVWKFAPDTFRTQPLMQVCATKYFRNDTTSINDEQRKELEAMQATILLFDSYSSSLLSSSDSSRKASHKIITPPLAEPRRQNETSARPVASNSRSSRANDDRKEPKTSQPVLSTKENIANDNYTASTTLQVVNTPERNEMGTTKGSTTNETAMKEKDATLLEEMDTAIMPNTQFRATTSPYPETMDNEATEEVMEEVKTPVKPRRIRLTKSPPGPCNDDNDDGANNTPMFDTDETATTPKTTVNARKATKAKVNKTLKTIKTNLKTTSGITALSKTKKLSTEPDEIWINVDIPSNRLIEKILAKGGYTIAKRSYVRPSCKEIFTTLAQLRTCLCRNGVNCQCKTTGEGTIACRCWNVDEKRAIFTWVRSHIFAKVFPRYQCMNENGAHDILLVLGFKESDVGYMFPGLFDDRSIRGGELFNELAKCGFPKLCNFESVSEEDRFNLECFVAFSYRFTFTFRPERRRYTTYSPNVSKPLRKTRPPASLSTVVTNDDVALTNASNKKRSLVTTAISTAPKSKKKRKNSTVVHYATTGVEYHVTSTETEPPMESPTTFLSTPKSDFVKDQSLVTFYPKESQPLPTFQGCDAYRLRAACATLSLANHFDNPSFQWDSPTPFTLNMDRVFKHLVDSVTNRIQKAISSNEECVTTSNALYVCGATGVGKTSGVHWCCEQFLKANQDKIATKLAVCKINASSLITDNKPSATAVDEVRMALGMKKATLASVCRRITRGATGSLAKSYLILVVDEIDALMTRSKLREVFKIFMELANNRFCQFTLIGISNSMSDGKFGLMQSSAKFANIVTFSAYSADELFHILRSRVGETIVDPTALQFVAKKVSRESGDARSALEMLSIAMQRRLETASDEFTSNGSLITLRDVHLVSQGDKETSVKSKIEGQSTSMKILLCILVSLSETGVVETSLGNLRSLVSECLTEAGHFDELLQADDFFLLIEMLIDQGLVYITQMSACTKISHGFLTGMTNAERAKQLVCLGTQSEEVEQVLKSDLTQSLYQTIQDQARRKGKSECSSSNNL